MILIFLTPSLIDSALIILIHRLQHLRGILPTHQLCMVVVPEVDVLVPDVLPQRVFASIGLVTVAVETRVIPDDLALPLASSLLALVDGIEGGVLVELLELEPALQDHVFLSYLLELVVQGQEDHELSDLILLLSLRVEEKLRLLVELFLAQLDDLVELVVLLAFVGQIRAVVQPDVFQNGRQNFSFRFHIRSRGFYRYNKFGNLGSRSSASISERRHGGRNRRFMF